MYKIERVFSEGGGLEMNGKLPKKAAIVGIVFVCCKLGFVNYRLKPIENTTPENVKEDEELWWGESGTAFIHESEIKVKDPALLDDTDRDWIDVDGLRDLSNGKAALIDDTNREWIGKEVMINAMVSFTKPDGTAWYLKKGETLSFEAEQYPLETTKTRNKNWKIKFGYLLCILR